jgi:hypothetical protein
MFGQYSITFWLKYQQLVFLTVLTPAGYQQYCRNKRGSWCDVATHPRQGRRTCRCAQRWPTIGWTPSGHGYRKVNLLSVCRRSSAGWSTRRNTSAPAFQDLQHDSMSLNCHGSNQLLIHRDTAYRRLIYLFYRKATTEPSFVQELLLIHWVYNRLITEPSSLQQSYYWTTESTTKLLLNH